MDRRLFFIIIVPTISLSVSELKKANSAPDTILAYRNVAISIAQNAKRELSTHKVMAPEPKAPEKIQVAKTLLVRRRNHHRDSSEIPEIADEICKISQEVNEKRNGAEDADQFVFLERIIGKKNKLKKEKILRTCRNQQCSVTLLKKEQ